jgi:tetratricopeptide (TPR) repeat protein
MPTHANLTLTPPTYWEEFEDMLLDLFRAEWNDPHAQKHGRSGQSQNGVDVYGQPDQKEKWAGVQAKKKDRLAASTVTARELVSEVNRAKKFTPKLSEFILATTGKRDKNIQEKARLLTEAHQIEGLFRVHVYSWEDIEDLLHKHLDVCKRWYPDLFPKDELVEAVDRIERAQMVTIASLTQQLSNLTSSITTSGAGSQKVYQIAIDQANALLDQFKPKTALAQLQALREKAWDGADQITQWKILTNIGAAKYQLNEDEEAARLLIEAAQYNQDDEKALCNLALGCLLLDDLSKAEQYIDIVLQKNPANERAYTLRARLLSLRNENFDTIVEQIPEKFRSLQEIAGALGDAAGKYGNLQKCQYWYEIAYKSKDPSPGVAVAYASSMLLSIAEGKLVLITGAVTINQKTQLENIIAIYSDAYTKLADSEQIAFKLECVFNRGVAWRLVGNYENAAKDFDLASELEPENDKFIFYRAELALVSGKQDVAISLLENIQGSKAYPAAPLLAEVYKEKRDYTKGREVLIQYFENDPPTAFREQACRLLIELLIASEQYDDAEKESAALIVANSENVLNVVIRAGVLKAVGKEKEAQEQLTAARRLVHTDTPFITILALADQYFAHQDFENAIPLYEMIADISVNNYITRNLLTCYYQSGKEKEALNICTILRQNYGALKIITEIEMQIYERIGNLEKAKEVCTEFLNRHPNDLSVQIRLARINFLQQNFEELDSFLKLPHPLADASLEDRIRLSHLLSSRGFSKQALDIMYEARRTFFNESEAHTRYIAIFFETEKELDPLLQVENVAENTAVLVKELRGESRWYIIEDRQDADIRKDELPLTHTLAKRLLGKQVGDKVVVSEGLQKKEGTIQEVKSKYVDALHKSAAMFEAYFPDAQGFSLLNLTMVTNPDAEGKVDFSPFFDMVDRQHQHLTQVLALYKAGQLTIGAVAKLLHKNPIEAWGLLINEPDIGVRCAIGDPQELADVRRVLTREHPRLVADITTLMTLHGLEVANEVVELFGKIAIAQSTIDQLTDLIIRRKGIGARGYMTLGKEGEAYVKEEITAEQIQKNTAYLEAIFDWIQHNCEVIACEEALTLASGQRQKLYDLFGADAIDSVLLAKQEKRVIVSEDERLRNFARDPYGVDGAWTQALLEQLLSKGQLDASTYQKLAIKLINSNYHYIRITAETLEEAAKQSAWKPNRQFEKVAGILSGGNSDDLSAVMVASDFIFKLYTQQLFLTDPSILLFTILDLLFTSGEKASILLAQLINHIRIRFAWLPAQQKEIVQLIQAWARRQIFY